MLTGEQGCRHDNRDLLATDGCDESRTQRDFGFAEADVATNEPIHRTSGAEILKGRIDCGQLIVSFLVGEARAEFVIGTRADR